MCLRTANQAPFWCNSVPRVCLCTGFRRKILPIERHERLVSDRGQSEPFLGFYIIPGQMPYKKTSTANPKKLKVCEAQISLRQSIIYCAMTHTKAKTAPRRSFLLCTDTHEGQNCTQNPDFAVHGHTRRPLLHQNPQNLNLATYQHARSTYKKLSALSLRST